MNALIFDCDGVLADTERDGHLPAFNEAFAQFGIPLRWSETEYATALEIGGGKERLAAALTPALLTKLGVKTDAQRSSFIAKLHAAKTEAFTTIVASGALPGRPGIARLARAMRDRGWRLAVASTSAEASVRAVLESVVGPADARSFAIFAGDAVARKKPAPDIYLLALDRLGISAREALVIEDSRIGLLAATAAGLRCLVTPTAFTRDQSMDAAALVVSSLGEPDGVRAQVIANRCRARIAHFVTPEDLVDCMNAPMLE
jgi:HAD superfamily hydrolase (TIGR01509 family)